MRKESVDVITEKLSFVPDENLPLVKEAVILLSHLTPPWLNKSTYEAPLIKLLNESKVADPDNHSMSGINDGYTTAEFYNPNEE